MMVAGGREGVGEARSARAEGAQRGRPGGRIGTRVAHDVRRRRGERPQPLPPGKQGGRARVVSAPARRTVADGGREAARSGGRPHAAVRAKGASGPMAASVRRGCAKGRAEPATAGPTRNLADGSGSTEPDERFRRASGARQSASEAFPIASSAPTGGQRERRRPSPVRAECLRATPTAAPAPQARSGGGGGGKCAAQQAFPPTTTRQGRRPPNGFGHGIGRRGPGAQVFERGSPRPQPTRWPGGPKRKGGKAVRISPGCPAGRRLAPAA